MMGEIIYKEESFNGYMSTGGKAEASLEPLLLLPHSHPEMFPSEVIFV